MRYLGIDYGSRRTGLAVGDNELAMAMPFELYEGLSPDELVQRIAQLVRLERIDGIICGLPLNMDGTIGPQAKLTETFIQSLEAATGLPIVRVDERLSSFHAEDLLAGNYTRKQKRQRVDALAAARILQDFLDQVPR